MLAALNRYFSRAEKMLWTAFVVLIVSSFLAFDGENFLALTASLIGVTSLLFNAKGNPVGQVVGIAFCLIYGYISWQYAYYGEMITYLGMTLPMSVVTLVIWLRNPFKGNRMCVQVGRLRRSDLFWLVFLTIVITAVFGYVLAVLHTANLVPSIVSISTSTIAVYLSWRRSPWFAAGYAANDLVLIVLWSLATVQDPGAVSVLMCFVAFFANDLYGFRNWRRMLCQRRLSKAASYIHAMTGMRRAGLPSL